jgi:hypothetical protein
LIDTPNTSVSTAVRVQVLGAITDPNRLWVQAGLAPSGRLSPSALSFELSSSHAAKTLMIWLQSQLMRVAPRALGNISAANKILLAQKLHDASQRVDAWQSAVGVGKFWAQLEHFFVLHHALEDKL